MANIEKYGWCQLDEEIVRPKADFRGSIWGDQFMNYEHDTQVAEKFSTEIEVLKGEVRSMLEAPECNMVETMNLIDTLERLGISYHFKHEIEDKVGRFFNENTNYADESYDLYTVSMHFRIFRQHGYRMSSDVFKKFKDASENFRESLKSDARGMLSLYEASHLRVHGESILEEALAFTTVNLKSLTLTSNLSPPLRKQIVHALFQPLHFGIPRIEAHSFITVYQEDVFSNETLLKFAKLDYNLLQMLHKQELCELTRWYRELDVLSRLPYVRDRLVECYYWAMGTYFEPQYSNARVMLTKTYIVTSLLDDTYDSYGTVEELNIFTEAIQRWDTSEIGRLPKYMDTVYKVMLETYGSFEEELVNEGRKYALYYAMEAVKELARAFHLEAIWFDQGYVPSFSEYLSNGVITCTEIIHTTTSLLGMKSVKQDEFEWLSSKPKVLVAGSKMGRLLNDISSYEREKKGQTVTGIDCYMKENHMTKEETVSAYIELMGNTWKDTNEECLKLSNCSRDVLPRIVNFDRVVEAVYKNFEDGYTEPEKVVKDHIIALLVDPIKLIS